MSEWEKYGIERGFVEYTRVHAPAMTILSVHDAYSIWLKLWVQ